MRALYYFPDGTSTFNHVLYVRTWRRLGLPIAKLLDATLMGFDPGLLLMRKSGTSFTMPSDVARLIDELLKELAKKKRKARKRPAKKTVAPR